MKSLKVMLILMLIGLSKLGYAQANPSYKDKVIGLASGFLEYGDPYEPFFNDLKTEADNDAASQCSTNPFPFIESQRITDYSIERTRTYPYAGEAYEVSALYRCIHTGW
ncbi:MAG: hypothetical protein HY390_07545 [Deltaproteobacteria bacterium]|nr:hypothetical protein [Deltaproteobacteria bacterium]